MKNSMKRTLLSAGVSVAIAAAAISATTVQASNSKGKYLITWMGDQMLDGNNHSPLDGLLGIPAGVLPDADFIGVIDANPKSPTYGQVVNTAEMPAVYGQHLLSNTDDFVDEALDLALQLGGQLTNGLTDAGLGASVQGDILGGVPNFNGASNGLPDVVPAPSSVLNEPHHHSVYPHVGADGSVNAYYGGLISSNVFGCDITDPMNIKPAAGTVQEDIPLHGADAQLCGLSETGRDMLFSGLDDLEYNPADGMYYTTMMGAGGQFAGAYSPTSPTGSSLPPVLTTPGGVLVFDPATDSIVAEVSAVPKAPVYGHGYFSGAGPKGTGMDVQGFYANAAPGEMLGPMRYAPRVQLGFGGLDDNGMCNGPAAGGTFEDGAIPTAVGVTAFNLCVPGVAPFNQIGADTGKPDTGLLAHPHGVGLRTDLDGEIADKDGNIIGETHGILMTSDYADPVSLALTGSGEGAAASKQNLGTTIRLWDLSNVEAGPYQVIQMPDGNRVEDNAIHEEPEGLMAMRVTHSHKGAFVASMCGGIIYYSADITVAKPEFKIVYDFGACTGASVFTITQNDKHMFVPISGIQQAGDPIHNRDYDGEHDGRVAVLNLRPLLKAGDNHSCDMSPVEAWNNTGTGEHTSPIDGAPATIGTAGLTYHNHGDANDGGDFWPNNGSRDCPRLVDEVNLAGTGEDGIVGTADDHPDAETTRGGPHFTTHDRNDRYIATSNYFVDLREFAIKDVDLLLSALGLGHAWDNGSGGTIPNAYPPGGPGHQEYAPGGLGQVHALLGVDGGIGNTLPGTGSVGDDTVCMMKWNRKRQNLKLDKRFNRNDANSPTGCIDMDFGDTGNKWVGTRHPDAGNATPHGMSFIKVGSNRFFTNGEIVDDDDHHGHH